jgi:hypothetical protein
MCARPRGQGWLPGLLAAGDPQDRSRRLSRSAAAQRSLARSAGGLGPRGGSPTGRPPHRPRLHDRVLRPPRPRQDPISDIDPLRIALAWRERDTSPLLAAFAEIHAKRYSPSCGTAISPR